MNRNELDKVFVDEVLRPMEQKHKVQDVKKCKAIFEKIAEASVGENAEGLRESALPKSLRPGSNYMKRMLKETDVVKLRKRPGSDWYYVDEIQNKVYYMYQFAEIFAEYTENLEKHIRQDTAARRELANALETTPERVNILLTEIIDTRNIDEYNVCVKALSHRFDVKSQGYGFLHWRRNAQYLELSEYGKKVIGG
jgi:hypothetical protein